MVAPGVDLAGCWRRAAARHPADRGTIWLDSTAGAAMSNYLIHVKSSNTGVWVVQPEDRDLPVSKHVSETDAERAAIERAAALEDCSIVIHDRYARVRVVRPVASSRLGRR
jgi:hypothetical protein